MSYSGNPSTTPKDAVRFLIGDTVSPEQFSDEEIVFLLQTQANYYMAAAVLSDQQTTKASSAGLTSKSIGGFSESYGTGSTQFYAEQAKAYRKLGSAYQVPSYETISQKFSFRQFDGFGGSPRVRCDRFDRPAKDEEQTF